MQDKIILITKTNLNIFLYKKHLYAFNSGFLVYICYLVKVNNEYLLNDDEELIKEYLIIRHI